MSPLSRRVYCRLSIRGTDHRFSWSVVPSPGPNSLTDDKKRSSVPPSGPGKPARVPSAKTVVGALIAADLLVLRLLVSGDENGVTLAGRPLAWVCAFRRQTGLPCPACGMTRAAALAVHGEWWRAWRMSPGGTALMAGLVVAAMVLLGLGLAEWLGKATTGRARNFLRLAALVYAGGATAVWLGGWIAQLAAAWPGYGNRY